MNKTYLIWAGVVALALAILGAIASDGRSADEEKIVVPKDMAKAINKMADETAKSDDLKKDAAALAKTYKEPEDFKKFMWVFKPRKPNGEGGFGVGPKLNAGGQGDGIETFILSQNRRTAKPMTPAALKDAAADLTRLADVTIALSEVTHAYTPAKKVGDKDPKVWKNWTDEMKKSAEDLKAGVKANKPEDVQKAFVKLNSSCNNCHGVFRD